MCGKMGPHRDPVRGIDQPDLKRPLDSQREPVVHYSGCADPLGGVPKALIQNEWACAFGDRRHSRAAGPKRISQPHRATAVSRRRPLSTPDEKLMPIGTLKAWSESRQLPCTTVWRRHIERSGRSRTLRLAPASSTGKAVAHFSCCTTLARVRASAEMDVRF